VYVNSKNTPQISSVLLCKYANEMQHKYKKVIKF